ncbi:MAG TPA: hypothetical protein VHR38_07755 [Solirubrobacterales bacterium]|nr:hypothetical protein [Solirubrobacterales bacterium]
MKPAKLLSTLAALLLLVGGTAEAVTNADGGLVTTFDGGLNPTVLPRDSPAPVAVHVSGSFRDAAGHPASLPQLQRIVVGINRGGKLFDRGLAVCRIGQIRSSREAVARRACGDAIVGKGHVGVQVRIPSQLPFTVRANLLAFNGPRRNGHKLIFAQAYARNPPGVFILTFRVDRRSGTYGTVLSTTLPAATRDWAYLTHFDMTLRRTYTYRDRERSFVSASCPAPAGFDRVVFPFAEATYSFGDGRQVSLSEGAVCRVARD